MVWRILLVLSLLSSLGHAALKVMAIGDSLTREYEIMAVNDGQGGTFPSPDSDPGNANTMNWVEILAEQRASEVDFGHYSDDTGHEYNYAIPGSDSNQWMDIINASLLDAEFYLRLRMWEDYNEVDVVVVMVGGNDVNFTYGELYDQLPGDITPEDFKTNVINNLEDIIDEIRSINATVPIVLTDIPDPSPTPDIISDHPDASKRAFVSNIVIELNQQVSALATSRGLTFARVSHLTDMLKATDPFYIGAIEMIKDKDPTRENRPLYLYCKEGLHPSTNGQAILANILIDAINSATGSTTPNLPNRVILETLLGLNPDQPFIDWLAAKGIAQISMLLDSDGDGIPNLGEFLLGLEPLVADAVHVSTIQWFDGAANLTMTYKPDSNAARLANILIKQSTNLTDWSLIPEANIHLLPDGHKQVRLPMGHDGLYTRMEFELLP